MKNTIKFLGIIAVIAIIGFSMAACDELESGGNPGGNNQGGVKTVRKDFNEPGGHFSVSIGTAADGIPVGTAVTVEVYAIGGGGGGQGGHRKAYVQGLGTRHESGRGAGGGAGAIAYAKFETVSPVTFTQIHVGARGNAGAAFDEGVGGNWRAGSAGTAGGKTEVYFNDENILFHVEAGGGAGGGGTGNQNVTGGAGGTAVLPSTSIGEFFTGTFSDAGFANGLSGANGRHNVQSTDDHGKGGERGELNKGSITNFTNYGLGGTGGYGNATIGSMLGFPGAVIIVVTESASE